MTSVRPFVESLTDISMSPTVHVNNNNYHEKYMIYNVYDMIASCSRQCKCLIPEKKRKKQFQLFTKIEYYTMDSVQWVYFLNLQIGETCYHQ